MSDLPAHRDVHCLMYADDISAFVIENSMEVVVENLQNFVDSCSSWIENQTFQLNSTK